MEGDTASHEGQGYKQTDADTKIIYRAIVKETTEGILQSDYIGGLIKENKTAKTSIKKLTTETSNLKVEVAGLNRDLKHYKDNFTNKNLIYGILNIIAIICIGGGLNYLTSNPPNTQGITLLVLGVIFNILAIIVLYLLSK